MTYDLTATSDYLQIQCCFFIQIDMSEYLIDYYHQRKDLIASVNNEQDSKLKELIACFAIHIAARSALETHAWTLNIVNEKPYSLFVTGNTGEMDAEGITRGFIVGNILTEHIRHSDTNGIHAQVTSRGRSFNSYVPCDTSDIREMTENFYAKSEQRPIRIILADDSDTAVALAAQPGYDEEWFENVNLSDLKTDYLKMEKTRMRTCKFSFKCDCSPDKLLPFFKSLATEEVSDLYGNDPELFITCPRCGKKFSVSRDQI